MEGLNKVFKYMVNNNIIHRDIKPDNILIKYIDDSKTKFIPKICDFGISRELENGVANTDVGTA
jgi:serine/threonine protein kinase